MSRIHIKAAAVLGLAIMSMTPTANTYPTGSNDHDSSSSSSSSSSNSNSNDNNTSTTLSPFTSRARLDFGKQGPPPPHEETGWPWPNYPWQRSWAQFCDDDDCSKNCGISVDMHNGGCLEQPAGRRSVRIHGARGPIDEQTFLAVSPAGGCGCQAACESVPTFGPAVNKDNTEWQGIDMSYKDVDYCWRLSYYPWHGKQRQWSFHFVEDKCQPNQCRWDGMPL